MQAAEPLQAVAVLSATEGRRLKLDATVQTVPKRGQPQIPSHLLAKPSVK